MAKVHTSLLETFIELYIQSVPKSFKNIFEQQLTIEINNCQQLTQIVLKCKSVLMLLRNPKRFSGLFPVL